jgi:hypothetical protein
MQIENAEQPFEAVMFYIMQCKSGTKLVVTNPLSDLIEPILLQQSTSCLKAYHLDSKK